MGSLKPSGKKTVIGLTGSFGSGKSTVAALLERKGAFVVDADAIAHKLLAPSCAAYAKLVSVFGRKILGPRKKVDRKKLAALVFSDTRKLLQLDSIMHPEIIKHIKGKIKSSRSSVVVVDAPLLIETGLDKFVDKVIVTVVDQDTQIRRLKEKKGFSKKEILQRIRRQIPLRQKVRLADVVIDNSGTKRQTRALVDTLWPMLKRC